MLASVSMAAVASSFTGVCDVCYGVEEEELEATTKLDVDNKGSKEKEDQKKS